jgi:hypothetical protein
MKKRTDKRSFDLLLSISFAFLSWTGTGQAGGDDAPVSLTPDDPPPLAIFAARPLHDAPPLGGKSKEGRAAVEAFLDWASASVPEERDDARQALAEMREDKVVASTLCRIAKKSSGSDGTRAMVAYALLGELRSEKGLRCLRSLVVRKAPTHGPVEAESGMPFAQLAWEQLQAKGVEGMAYHGSDEADAMVLDVVASHPSRSVRAAAIDAWLWNHGDGEEARLALLQVIDPKDSIFLDRVRREEGESAASFDAKLATFLALHPELQAPEPEETDEDDKGEEAGKNPPPPDEGFRFEETRPECVSAAAPACNGTCETGKVCAHDDVAGNCSCVVEVIP